MTGARFTHNRSFLSASRIDVITIEKTGEHFRLIYDVKGRFTIHRISSEEAKVSIRCGSNIPCDCGRVSLFQSES